MKTIHVLVVVLALSRVACAGDITAIGAFLCR